MLNTASLEHLSIHFFFFTVEKFRKQRGLKTFGMPYLIASGSHDLNSIKHRFIIIPRYGQNIWNIFLENNRRLPQHTVYRLAIQMVSQ